MTDSKECQNYDKCSSCIEYSCTCECHIINRFNKVNPYGIKEFLELNK